MLSIHCPCSSYFLCFLSLLLNYKLFFAFFKSSRRLFKLSTVLTEKENFLTSVFAYLCISPCSPAACLLCAHSLSDVLLKIPVSLSSVLEFFGLVRCLVPSFFALESAVPASVRRICNFFYSLPSKSKQIWILFASYSHVSVYSQTPFIHIIRSYSFPNIHTNSHAKIQFDAKIIHV
jgi:hypothetical protein